MTDTRVEDLERELRIVRRGMRGTWWQWLIIAVVGLAVFFTVVGSIVTLYGCKPGPTYRFRSM
jgi:hypothetical protein